MNFLHWLGWLFLRIDFRPRAMRASPDRAETTKIGSVGEADSTRSGEAGGAQDSARVRIGDGQ